MRIASSWLLVSMALAFMAGCSRGEKLPEAVGAYYQTEQKELVPLVRGTSRNMLERAIPINEARPTFYLYHPDIPISNVRIGVRIKKPKINSYKRADIAVVPVEGKTGLYRLTPRVDLQRGLGAIILSGGVFGQDEIYSDVENVYPFTVGPKDGVAGQEDFKKLAYTIFDSLALAAGIKPGVLDDKSLLINFYATGCETCVKSGITIIETYYAQEDVKQGRRDIQAWGVSLDASGQEKPLKLAYPYLFLGEREAALQLMSRLGNQAGSLPFTVLLDKDGEIVYSRVGLVEVSELNRAFELVR